MSTFFFLNNVHFYFRKQCEFGRSFAWSVIDYDYVELDQSIHQVFVSSYFLENFSIKGDFMWNIAHHSARRWCNTDTVYKIRICFK